MFNYSQCLICQGTSFEPFLTCKDHTVSQEKFNIVSCRGCGFKFTNTVPDVESIGKYYKSEQYISHSDTNKGIVARIYHLVRSYTLKRKVELVSKYVSRGTILDYGAGTGAFSKVCSDRGWGVTGMEPDQGARQTALKRGVNVLANKEDLKAANSGPFDAITLWHVLEHVSDLHETIQYFSDHISTKGVLIIAVPNYRSFDAEYYKEFWAAYDVPRHLYHFDKKSIQQLLNDKGFKLIDVVPMKFDSYYVSLLSEKYENGSNNYLKALWRGFISNAKAVSTGNYSSLIYVFKLK